MLDRVNGCTGDASAAPPTYVQYTMHMQQQQLYHTGVTTTMNPVIGQYVTPLTNVPTVRTRSRVHTVYAAGVVDYAVG
jgi:hypothetical protein